LKKNLLVIAGPNGSGKSTIMNMIRTDSNWQNYIYISPDEVVKEEKYLGIEDELTRYRTTMRDCQIARNQVISHRHSLAFETVFSTKEKMDFLLLAKSSGYEVNVIVVTTADPEINIKRIAQRVSEGGHDVPPDKVISRYERSMSFLYPIFETADYMSVYDNSGDKSLPFFIRERIYVII
jgi:predicted ABC-type ATPase